MNTVNNDRSVVLTSVRTSSTEKSHPPTQVCTDENATTTTTTTYNQQQQQAQRRPNNLNLSLTSTRSTDASPNYIMAETRLNRTMPAVQEKSRKRSRNLRHFWKAVGRSGKVQRGQPDSTAFIGQLFQRELDDICTDGRLPLALYNLLQCLWEVGPHTEGVFRLCPSIKKCRELRDAVDSGNSTLNDSDMTPYLAASLLKDLLRSLPDCLLGCQYYSRWIHTATCVNITDALNHMKRLTEFLTANQLLVLRHVIAVLQRISKHRDETRMTSSNLAVCIGPSLLWQSPVASPLSGTSGGSPSPQMGLLEDHGRVSLIVERLIDYPDVLFDEKWVDPFSDVMEPVFTLQRFASSFDDSDTLTDTDVGAVTSLSQSDVDFSTPHSMDSPTSLTSTAPRLSLSLVAADCDVTVTSPVPPPRTKKLRRQHATQQLGTDITRPLSSTMEYLLPSPAITVLSDDSQFESLEDISDRNHAAYDVTGSSKLMSLPRTANQRRESARCMTSADDTAEGSVDENLLRRCSAPVTASDMQQLQQTLKVSSASRLVEQVTAGPDKATSRSQHLSTDSAISVSLDNVEEQQQETTVRHRLSLLREQHVTTSDTASDEDEQLNQRTTTDCSDFSKVDRTRHQIDSHEQIAISSQADDNSSQVDAVLNSTESVDCGSCRPTSSHQSVDTSNQQSLIEQLHSEVFSQQTNEQQQKQLQQSEQPTQQHNNNNNNRKPVARRGMTLTGADLFPARMRTSALFIDDTVVNLHHQEQQQQQPPTAAVPITTTTTTQNDVTVMTSAMASDVPLQKEMERRRKLATLRQRHAQSRRLRYQGDSSSSSGSHSDAECSGSDGEGRTTRLRHAQQRRSYNQATRQQHRDKFNIVSRSHSDSVQTRTTLQNRHKINSLTDTINQLPSDVTSSVTSSKVAASTTCQGRHTVTSLLRELTASSNRLDAPVMESIRASYTLTSTPASVNSVTSSQIDSRTTSQDDSVLKAAMTSLRMTTPVNVPVTSRQVDIASSRNLAPINQKPSQPSTDSNNNNNNVMSEQQTQNIFYVSDIKKLLTGASTTTATMTSQQQQQQQHLTTPQSVSSKPNDFCVSAPGVTLFNLRKVGNNPNTTHNLATSSTSTQSLVAVKPSHDVTAVTSSQLQQQATPTSTGKTQSPQQPSSQQQVADTTKQRVTVKQREWHRELAAEYQLAVSDTSATRHQPNNCQVAATCRVGGIIRRHSDVTKPMATCSVASTTTSSVTSMCSTGASQAVKPFNNCGRSTLTETMRIVHHRPQTTDHHHQQQQQGIQEKELTTDREQRDNVERVDTDSHRYSVNWSVSNLRNVFSKQ